MSLWRRKALEHFPKDMEREIQDADNIYSLWLQFHDERRSLLTNEDAEFCAFANLLWEYAHWYITEFLCDPHMMTSLYVCLLEHVFDEEVAKDQALQDCEEVSPSVWRQFGQFYDANALSRAASKPAQVHKEPKLIKRRRKDNDSRYMNDE